MAVLSVLAVAFGLTGCGDDSNSDDNKKCDPALKPATAISCDCVDNSWQFCVYPQGDKCASSNCGPGTTCDSATGDCIPNSSSCTCDDGTACPDGNKANCSGAQTCTCDDGTACPGGNKANCNSSSSCNKADKPKGAKSCECNESAHQWECKFDCDENERPKKASSCLCNENNGQWECRYECDEASKAPNAICSCDEQYGIWKDDCTYTCLDGLKPNNATTCSCNNQTGLWENCKYACNDNYKPYKATTCDCDDNTGEWINSTCKYTCDPEPPNAIPYSCQCNENTGILESCRFSCGEEPANAIANTCECNETIGILENCRYSCGEEPSNVIANTCHCNENTGTYEGCQYIACNVSEKPTAADHATSCECVEAEWNCQYDCTWHAQPEFAETCDCIKGEWANCVINKCKGKTWLSYQKCDPATGNIEIAEEPYIYFFGWNGTEYTRLTEYSITEGKWINLQVGLSHEPGEDITLSMTPTENSRFKIAPSTVTIQKSKWTEKKSFTITTIDNNSIDGNTDHILRVKTTTTTEVGYKNKSASFGLTVIDDDQPGIVLTCNNDKIIQASWDYGFMDVWDGHPANDMNEFNNNTTTSQLNCSVKLASAPSSNVTVSIKGSHTGGSIPSHYYSLNETLTFTPSNYNTEQLINKFFGFPFHETEITSTKPLTYTLTAKSDTTGYVVDPISKEFTVRPMTKYIIFNKNTLVAGSWPRGQKVTLPAGKYRLHAWGASGGKADDPNMEIFDGFACTNSGGAGAYIRADLTLTEPTLIYVYVGEAGESCTESCYADNIYNGGGYASASINYGAAGNGGGGTDFCIGNDACKTYDTHWPYRILVAGGGGGGSKSYSCIDDWSTGSGGSATWQGDSGSGWSPISGHNFMGGVSNTITETCSDWSSVFGKGMNANQNYSRVGGGGGGWYGGQINGAWSSDLGGGAGSSYAFKGSNRGCQGKQDAKYALSNVNGQNGLASFMYTEGDEGTFPYMEETIVDRYYKRLYLWNVYNHDKSYVGNIGDGFAIIETLY